MITQTILRSIARDIYENTNADSIIAGGAPRDIDLGVNPKDVDVFVEVNNEREENDYLDFMQETMGYRQIGRARGEEYEQALNPIQSVWDYSVQFGQNPIPVQFIFLKRQEMPEKNNIVRRVLKLFDVNVCRIALKYDDLNEKTKIYKDWYYKNGVQEKQVSETDTFYFNRELNQEARDNTKRRIQRIARKLHWRGSYGIENVDRERWDFRLPEPVVVPRDEAAWVNEANMVDPQVFDAMRDMVRARYAPGQAQVVPGRPYRQFQVNVPINNNPVANNVWFNAPWRNPM